MQAARTQQLKGRGNAVHEHEWPKPLRPALQALVDEARHTRQLELAQHLQHRHRTSYALLGTAQ